MTKVKYLQNSEPYGKGDVVEVADDVATGLVDMGIAEKADADEPLRIQAADANLTVSPTAGGANAANLRARRKDAEALMAENADPADVTDPMAETVQRAATSSGREAFMSGPSNEPRKGTEAEPEDAAPAPKKAAAKRTAKKK